MCGNSFPIRFGTTARRGTLTARLVRFGAMLRMRAVQGGVMAALGLAPPVHACEVALALTVDVSGSINETEYRLQMDGLAAALVDGTVAEALVRARAQVAVIQWSGKSRQDVTIPWTQISDFADVDALAADVQASVRPWRHFSTAIGEVLSLSREMFGTVDCARQVIDVSGDGRSNEGADPAVLRDQLAREGITINALAILGASDDSLPGYFRENVIVGPNAFVYVAAGYADYPRAIRRKLLDELTEPVS